MILIAAVIVAAVSAGVRLHRRLGPEGSTTASRRILSLMIFGLYPPVEFFNLARLQVDGNVAGGIGLAWLALIILGLIAWRVARRWPRPSTGALINAALHPNTGYLGLPLCATALGTGSLSRAIAYDTLVGVPTLLLGVFTVASIFGTAASGVWDRVRRVLLRNPGLWASVAGLLAPASVAPDTVIDITHLLVYAMLPLGFCAVGLTLAGEGIRFPPPLTRPVVTALGLRLIVAPALLFVLAAPLIDLPAAYLILAAMSTGVNGLGVAHVYGLDVGLAASAIVWGTAIVVSAAVVITLVT